MRISDWSSDVCSSDLDLVTVALAVDVGHFGDVGAAITAAAAFDGAHALADRAAAVAIGVVIIAITIARIVVKAAVTVVVAVGTVAIAARQNRSAEHTSELPSLKPISYAGICLQKKQKSRQTTT